MKKKEFFRGMKDGIPIALAYLAVSFALGITAGRIGFTAVEAFAASVTTLASAGEYAAFSFISVGAGFAEVALIELITGARYFLMSATLTQKLSPSMPFYHRFLIAIGVTDEIFAIDIARDGYLVPSYHYGAMSVSVPAWAVGTALGVVAGNVLPAVLVSALGIALYGMFLSIIVPPAMKNGTVAATVLAGFALSTLSEKLPALSGIPSGVKMIVLTVVISLAAALIKPIGEAESGGEAR